MDFEKLLFFGFLWFLFNLLRRGGTQASRRPPSPPPPTPRSPDATQREGSRLETLLRDLNRGLEEAARAKAKNAEPDEVEETETLEVVPEAVTLERDVRRAERAPVDQDDLAEQVVARRIAAAAAAGRGKALTAADHRAFDQRIRQEPADHTAVRTYTPKQLRDAVVWREILGPPAALRDQ